MDGRTDGWTAPYHNMTDFRRAYKNQSEISRLFTAHTLPQRLCNYNEQAQMNSFSNCPGKLLTHWGRVLHISGCKLIIIGSDNGLSPGRHQATIWTNVGILLIWPLGIKIQWNINTFPFKKTNLNMSSVKCQLFCLGLNVLIKISIIFCYQSLFIGLYMVVNYFPEKWQWKGKIRKRKYVNQRNWVWYKLTQLIKSYIVNECA